MHNPCKRFPSFSDESAYRACADHSAEINISSSSRGQLLLGKKYFRLTHENRRTAHFNLLFFVDFACFASKHAPVRSIDSITSEITRIYTSSHVRCVIMLPRMTEQEHIQK